MRHLSFGLLALALLLPACADDGAVDDNTSRGWRATSLAIGDQQTEWGTSVDAEGNLAAQFGCVDGGHATIEGSYSDENEFDVAMTFDGCTADGVVISGSLAMHAEIVLTDHSSDVSIDYGGTLQWSGAAQGSCEIDMSAEVSASITGTGAQTQADFDAEFHGTVCDYDADAVVSASAS